MFCTKCGKEIPDESRFCTFCGTEIENVNQQSNVNTQSDTTNSKMIKLTVTRKKRMLGFAVPMKILIDGNQIASLKNDNSIDIELPAGQHRLIVDTVGEVTDKTLDLNPEDNKVIVTLIMKMGLVTGKAAIESIKHE